METTLTAVCRHVKNYFVHSVERCDFTIANGIINAGPYNIGQYIRIVGSTLNDGVYYVSNSRIALDGARNEVFTGAVCGLAIPADFLELVGEITSFQERAANSPNLGLVKSETFPNYSYTTATGANGMPATWKEVFASRLSPYRKMFDEVML